MSKKNFKEKLVRIGVWNTFQKLLSEAVAENFQKIHWKRSMKVNKNCAYKNLIKNLTKTSRFSKNFHHAFRTAVFKSSYLQTFYIITDPKFPHKYLGKNLQVSPLWVDLKTVSFGLYSSEFHHGLLPRFFCKIFRTATFENASRWQL